jgi:hypothetical protein
MSSSFASDAIIIPTIVYRWKMVKRKNPHAVALGKLGGSKGGKIRASKLTAEQRTEIARKAVQTRWAKAKEGRRPRARKSGETE